MDIERIRDLYGVLIKSAADKSKKDNKKSTKDEPKKEKDKQKPFFTPVLPAVGGYVGAKKGYNSVVNAEMARGKWGDRYHTYFKDWKMSGKPATMTKQWVPNEGRVRSDIRETPTSGSWKYDIDTGKPDITKNDKTIYETAAKNTPRAKAFFYKDPITGKRTARIFSTEARSGAARSALFEAKARPAGLKGGMVGGAIGVGAGLLLENMIDRMASRL